MNKKNKRLKNSLEVFTSKEFAEKRKVEPNFDLMDYYLIGGLTSQILFIRDTDYFKVKN
jgi:hypothetical protein